MQILGNGVYKLVWSGTATADYGEIWFHSQGKVWSQSGGTLKMAAPPTSTNGSDVLGKIYNIFPSKSTYEDLSMLSTNYLKMWNFRSFTISVLY